MQSKYVDPGTVYDRTDRKLAQMIQDQRKALGDLTAYNFVLCSQPFVTPAQESKYEVLKQVYEYATIKVIDWIPRTE